MIYGNIINFSVTGKRIDYSIRKNYKRRWIELEPNNKIGISLQVEIDDLTTFIDELMEIRDYINTHPEFQGGNEE